MVRIGTPKNIEDYKIVCYPIASIIQRSGIFPIWRDDNFMYFEKTDKLRDFKIYCIGEEKLADEGIY